MHSFIFWSFPLWQDFSAHFQLVSFQLMLFSWFYDTIFCYNKSRKPLHCLHFFRFNGRMIIFSLLLSFTIHVLDALACSNDSQTVTQIRSRATKETIEQACRVRLSLFHGIELHLSPFSLHHVLASCVFYVQYGVFRLVVNALFSSSNMELSLFAGLF